jgi:hypothetical protein
VGERRQGEVADWDSNNYKAGHLRWIKMAQERNQHVAYEEKRKDEVLGIFRSLVELSSKERADLADSPPSRW